MNVPSMRKNLDRNLLASARPTVVLWAEQKNAALGSDTVFAGESLLRQRIDDESLQREQDVVDAFQLLEGNVADVRQVDVRRHLELFEIFDDAVRRDPGLPPQDLERSANLMDAQPRRKVEDPLHVDRPGVPVQHSLEEKAVILHVQPIA